MFKESRLTTADLVKYPFTVEASSYVEKRLGRLGLEELFNPNYEPVIEKAILRIKRSVLTPLKSIQTLKEKVDDVDVEILSFPLAIIMMKVVDDPYFQRRFALFEAKKASSNLENEDVEKLLEVARKSFGWKIFKVDGSFSGMLKIRFTDYLRNASKLREDKWKLVNRYLEYGDVYVTKAEAARLLEEEIRRHIQSKIDEKVVLELPKPVLEKVEELKEFLRKQKKSLPEESFGRVDFKFFPPCIKNIYTDILGGKNVSHIGRFTLTAFLIQIGMNIDDIVKLYTSATDFDERITRYQVEHIAGLVGGRTRYKPLNCESMQTHGLCVGRDEVCQKVKNPLAYYRRVAVRGKRVKHESH
ncbi:MAG: DNA primase regulatory subunit PriL [Candidatus Hecatellales archaeon]|nr:MAG: DNA primase regulatory subunit PriL [Candidatus Hecatellales archaeon]